MANGETRVCGGCFGVVFIKREIKRNGQKDVCEYCGRTRNTLRLEELANLFETAFSTHYERTASEQSPFEQAMGDTWWRDGQPVLDLMQEIGETTKEIAEDIRDLLESRHSTREDYEMGLETEFDSDSYYESRAVPRGDLDAEWRLFEHSLKTESRYFSHTVMRTLDKIFNDLKEHRTYQGASVIVDAGPNGTIKALYRARAFQSQEGLFAALERPEISIGPPPPAVAGAGRMNARGIPVFYGATHPEAALAEVRPPVGSKVVVAQFNIARPLRLLDVASLQSLSVGGSPFDPMYLARKQKAEFLEGLSERITMPVMPDDEALKYIPTQVIAEYLASLDNPTLDGMIYPSVQTAEEMKNVVLFHKAAVVAKVKRPEGVKFSVRDYESYEGSPEIEYSVVEEFDSEAPSLPREESTMDELIAEMIAEDNAIVDQRVPALELSRKNVWVHHIKRVAITSETFQLTRKEWDKKTFREFEESQKRNWMSVKKPVDPIEF
jgi:hypothetical protein